MNSSKDQTNKNSSCIPNESHQKTNNDSDSCKNARQNWDIAFAEIAKKGDDHLLIPDVFADEF